MKKNNSIGSFFIRLVLATFLVSGVFIATQDVQLFPAVFSFGPGHSSPIPTDFAESTFIHTEDGENIEVWRVEAKPEKKRNEVAIIFHGNAGNVANFYPYQVWFRNGGITNYDFDYRGIGNSTGWPSEAGLYKDARAVWNYVKKRENITNENVILFGISIGTGVAAQLAAAIEPKTLVLVTPYTSLPQLVDKMGWIRILKSFMWWELPTRKYVSSLKNTSLIILHGKRDSIIPISLGRSLYRNYGGTAGSVFIESPHGGHNDVFFLEKSRLKETMLKVLDMKGMPEPSPLSQTQNP